MQPPEDHLSLGAILEPIRNRLTVGKKVLLAVAWCREDELPLFDLYPEVLMFDVTFGTNNEGRPMGITASPDGDMNVFTPIRAFLPSQCRWVVLDDNYSDHKYKPCNRTKEDEQKEDYEVVKEEGEKSILRIYKKECRGKYTKADCGQS